MKKHWLILGVLAFSLSGVRVNAQKQTSTRPERVAAPATVGSVAGGECTDNDGDGYGVGAGCLGSECNDANGDINPGEDELCTGDCCALERAACTTLVKVVDEGGRVLAVDARKLLGVAANDMVVVRGKVSKDEAGNFSVLADGVHVRR